MADLHDALEAEREATNVIASTEATLAEREDGGFKGPEYDALVVAQSNLAVARAVLALGVRLDYVAHDLLARARR